MISGRLFLFTLALLVAQGASAGSHASLIPFLSQAVISAPPMVKDTGRVYIDGTNGIEAFERNKKEIQAEQVKWLNVPDEDRAALNGIFSSTGSLTEFQVVCYEQLLPRSGSGKRYTFHYKTTLSLEKMEDNNSALKIYFEKGRNPGRKQYNPDGGPGTSDGTIYLSHDDPEGQGVSPAIEGKSAFYKKRLRIFPLKSKNGQTDLAFEINGYDGDYTSEIHCR